MTHSRTCLLGDHASVSPAARPRPVPLRFCTWYQLLKHARCALRRAGRSEPPWLHATRVASAPVSPGGVLARGGGPGALSGRGRAHRPHQSRAPAPEAKTASLHTCRTRRSISSRDGATSNTLRPSAHDLVMCARMRSLLTRTDRIPLKPAQQRRRPSVFHRVPRSSGPPRPVARHVVSVPLSVHTSSNG